MSARRKTETDEPAMTAAEVKAARENQQAPVEGGRYKTADGEWVNAHGDIITATGKVKDADA